MRKPKYFYKQSAVIPFRVKNGRFEILLITSSKKKKWIIPKGIIEQNMTPQESALKEALEEAGVSGKVSEKMFGEYSYKKWGDTCNVKVYLMKVTKELEKWMEDYRKRKWMSVNDAAKLVENEDLIKLLYNTEETVKRNGYKINGK